MIQVASYNEHTAALVALTSDSSVASVGSPFASEVAEDSDQRFLRNLRSLYSEGLFSDVTFIVEGQRLSAHRAILAARSEHFASMFLSGMRESLDVEIPIPQVRYDIFSALLEFLYTNKVAQLSGEDAVELYVVADLYQIEDLKTLCRDIVLQSLTLQSAPLLLMSCHSFGLQELKDVCLSYMVRHFDIVSRTQEFSEMSKELLLEVVQKRAPVVVSPLNSSQLRPPFGPFDK